MSTPITAPTEAELAERTNRIAERLFTAQRDYTHDAREAAEQGFRPHYCIHGTNQWTDYDNICQGCEDGHFSEHSSPSEVFAHARHLAEVEAQREAEEKARQEQEAQQERERQRQRTERLLDGVRAQADDEDPMLIDPRIYRNGDDAVVIYKDPTGETRVMEFRLDGEDLYGTVS